ncbi:c-type cytochrome [Candidatus Oscillochloris fontis]|uniref:c-type cytochrome n=1 Tax=Candidatus Oscillochloris fontis TaxID=2496868 RepID=UPI0013754A99|nr:cytochrome c [Candidatus Oscillochloris fontis]
MALISVWVLAACGSQSVVATDVVTSTTTALPTVHPDQGKAIFNGQVEIDGFVACLNCHPINPHAPSGVGPNLAGIALRASERVPELSAATYIQRSIRIHDEYVVPGYTAGIARSFVGRDFDDVLSDEQVTQLVAYLLTLDQPPVNPYALSIARHPSATPAPSSAVSPSVAATTRPTIPPPTPSRIADATATLTSSPTLMAAPTSSPTLTAVVDTPIPTFTATLLPTSEATLPAPTATPAPVPTPTLVPPTVEPTPTAEPTVEELPSAPNDPGIARYAPCVTCHNQHPLQVLMPHPLNPTCNQCHRGSPNQIGCPSCHSMHGIDNKHEATPDLPCASCHT